MNIDEIISQLGKLGGAPAYTLVFLLCIITCVTLTKFKRFPNDGIWLASVLLGGFVNVLIADPMSDTLTFRVWMVKNAVLGLIFGGAGAFTHAVLLKKLLAKFGFAEDEAPKPPTNPT